MRRSPHPADDSAVPNLLFASPAHDRSDAGSTEQRTPRPVFVLGPLRSGVSLLELSLGQHPNLLPVVETNWFERFGIGLQQAFGDGLHNRNRSQLDVDGIEIEDFFIYFGQAIDRLMLRSIPVGDNQASDDPATPSYRPDRWIDASPRNAFAVFVLTRLFPEARFIHVVRDVNEVVYALSSDDTRRLYRSRFLGLGQEAAYRHWLDTTCACLDAERAFGSAVVTRIRRDDLVAAPEQTLRRCLDFLGEPFSPACLRPFSSIAPKTTLRMTGLDSAGNKPSPRKIRDEAEALNYLIRAETPSIAASPAVDPDALAYPPDSMRIVAMEAAFSARCARGKSAVPSSLPGFGPRRGRAGKLAERLPTDLIRGMITREPRTR